MVGIEGFRFHSGLRASFYRGGTSRGLIVTASHLTPYDQPTRDAMLCAAMGSPDPDGRQIDGLGGGASSLSKVAVIGGPGRGFVKEAAEAGNPFPGVAWADDYQQAYDRKNGWDVVYRFGQVPIRSGNTIDWSTTCGNLVAAVAHATVRTQTVSPNRVEHIVTSTGRSLTDEFRLPLRILCAHNGKRIIAHVPVARVGSLWQPVDVGSASIAGVPGTAPSTIIETPLDTASLLPTGNITDVVTLGDGSQVTVSIVDAGLPVIFVQASALDVDYAKLTSHPADLDADGELGQRVEHLRQRASQLSSELRSLYFPGSASPKVCLLHSRAPYKTTGGQEVRDGDIDLVARAVSVGQFHRTIPATTLSALGVASGFHGSIVSQTFKAGTKEATPPAPEWAKELNRGSRSLIRSLRVGQPAGVSSTCIRVPPGAAQPDAILMERTAKLIMNGEVLVPAELLHNKFQPFVNLLKKTRKRFEPASASRTDLNDLPPSLTPRVYKSDLEKQKRAQKKAIRAQDEAADQDAKTETWVEKLEKRAMKAKRRAMAKQIELEQAMKERAAKAKKEKRANKEVVVEPSSHALEAQVDATNGPSPSSIEETIPVEVQGGVTGTTPSHALEAQAEMASGTTPSVPSVEEAVPVKVDGEEDGSAPSHALEAQAGAATPEPAVDEAVPVKVAGEEAASKDPSHALEAQVDQSAGASTQVEGQVPVDVTSGSGAGTPKSSHSTTSSTPFPSASGQRRPYSTSAAAPAPFQPLHLFRHLSRAIARHPELHKPTKRSLRKLIRDDFAYEMERTTDGKWEQVDVEALQQRVRSSLLLLLLASKRRPHTLKDKHSSATRQTIPHYITTRRLSLSLLSNLSSLTYHHLCPNTYFPSLLHPRLTGGSDTGAARSLRAKLALPPSPAELAVARAAFGSKAAEGMRNLEGIGGSQRPLLVLSTPPRPERGPVAPSGRRVEGGGWLGGRSKGEAAHDLVQEAWNGQKVRVPPQGKGGKKDEEGEEEDGQSAILESKDRLGEQIDALKQRIEAKEAAAAASFPVDTTPRSRSRGSKPSPSSSHSSSPHDHHQLRKLRNELSSKQTELKHLLGIMKSQRRAEAKRLVEVQLRRQAKEALFEVVGRAARIGAVDDAGEPSLVFGTARWKRWYEGKFLPP